MGGERRLLNIIAIVVGLTVVAAVVWLLFSMRSRDAVGPSEASPSPVAEVGDAPPEASVPGRLRGRVVEEPSGEPVAGATVTLSTAEGEVSVVSGEDGAFDLVAPGEFGIVVAEAPGLRSGGRDDDGMRVRVPSGQTLNGLRVALYEPAAVRGWVSLHGRPAEARVTAHYARDGSGAGGYDSDFIETDAEGRFRLIGLAPGRLRLRVEAPGAAPRESETVDLWPGDIVDVGELGLRAGGSVLGRVLDREGAPVVGARIEAETVGSQVPNVAVRTNEHGVYALYGVAAGTLSLRVEAPGMRQLSEQAELAPEEELVREFVLEPLNGIVVRVVDGQGAAVRGALVEVHDVAAAEGDAPLRSLTVEDGPLYLSDLEGGPFRVEARALGQEVSTSVFVGGTAELVLAGEASLRGMVLRADGSRASTARLVLALEQPDGTRQNVRAETTQDGRFAFAELVPGRYVLVGSDEGHRVTESAPIEITGGEASLTLRLALGGVLAGTVRDAATGQPVAGANVRIEVNRRAVVSDASGAYRLAGFPAERTSVRVSAPGYRGAVVSALEIADGQVIRRDLELSPLGEGEEDGGNLELVGVGMRVGMEEAGLVVLDPVAQSAAARAGLQAGDVIVAIDGQDPRELGLRDAIERIRGELGTSVSLRVQRGDGAPFEISVVRERVVFER